MEKRGKIVETGRKKTDRAEKQKKQTERKKQKKADRTERGADMNNSGTTTYEKVLIPVRLPPEVYEQVMERVHQQKKTHRGYSMNQYLTDLILKDLQKK